MGGFRRLRVGELVDQLDLFYNIPSGYANKFAEIVFGEAFIDPKCDILLISGAKLKNTESGLPLPVPPFLSLFNQYLENGRVFGVGSKFGDLSSFELLGETVILAPEQSNIRNIKQYHGQAFEPKSKSPGPLIAKASALQDFMFHDSTPQDLRHNSRPGQIHNQPRSIENSRHQF